LLSRYFFLDLTKITIFGTRNIGLDQNCDKC